MRNISCFVLIIICQNQYAQLDSIFKAQEFCNQKLFDKALPVINKVVLHPETKGDAGAWHIRAFVYSQKYNESGRNLATSNLLDSSVQSALKSIQLDKDKEFLAPNNAFIENSAKKFRKLSVMLFQDSLDFVRSELFYLKYTKTIRYVNPSFQKKESDIEYYNAIGSKFTDLFVNSGDFNQKYGDVSKLALLRVLELDPKNIQANINFGILYYNQGVSLIKQVNYDIDLSAVDVLQENAKKLFKQSLPFLNTVYELDPQEIRALEGLEAIYYVLQEPEKQEMFKKKKEALNKSK